MLSPSAEWAVYPTFEISDPIASVQNLKLWPVLPFLPFQRAQNYKHGRFSNVEGLSLEGRLTYKKVIVKVHGQRLRLGSDAHG
jgi:hypothetical protein